MTAQRAGIKLGPPLIKDAIPTTHIYAGVSTAVLHGDDFWVDIHKIVLLSTRLLKLLQLNQIHDPRLLGNYYRQGLFILEPLWIKKNAGS